MAVQTLLPLLLLPCHDDHAHAAFLATFWTRKVHGSEFSLKIGNWR